MSTDIDIQYYDAVEEEWVDLTNFATAFTVNDEGILRVPTATVNLAGLRTDFTDYLAAPYKLIRIQVNPGTLYPIFYGYVDNPHIKTVSGVGTSQVKLSLDCLGHSARLAADYITFDYYRLNSAILPSANALTWRDMMEDALANPDSAVDTGFVIDAATNTDTIDHVIDSSATWDRQTLLEMIRIVCDRIGMDGYYDLQDEVSFVPEITLSGFSKVALETLADPFVGEPEYTYGSLQDVSNFIHVWGGIDRGVPADGDRITEYGIAKYSPAAWNTHLYDRIPISGGTYQTTGTASDEDNTDFAEETFRVGTKCIKSLAHNTLNRGMRFIFTNANSDLSTIDAENRLTELEFNINFFSTAALGFYFYVTLTDDSGQHITKFIKCTIPSRVSSGFVTWVDGNEAHLTLPIGTNVYIGTTPGNSDESWNYFTGSSGFNWADIRLVTLEMEYITTANDACDWGIEVDGLMFIGGYAIEPFRPYSATLNPPVQDATSIAAYGIHVMHHQDTMLMSFEQAQAEGARVLANNKNPVPLLTCTKATPFNRALALRPSHVVTVDSVDRRIANISYNWKAATRKCETTYKLIAKTAPLPPIWTLDNTLRYLIK